MRRPNPSTAHAGPNSYGGANRSAVRMSWAGDISVGFAVELETTSQFVGLRDTGTGRKLVLLNPNGASRLTIRAG